MQTPVYTVCSSKVCTVSLVYTKICKLNLNRVQNMINLIRMACAHSVNMVQTSFVPARCRASSIDASTSMLFCRRLPPNEAWLLVFRALVLTAGLYRPSVTCVAGHGPDAAHGGVVVRPVRRRVRLLAAEEGAKGPVLVRHTVRKHPLEALQRVAAHGVEPL